ncbi:unnamed protein product, partial [Owenia fusiformis]
MTLSGQAQYTGTKALYNNRSPSSQSQYTGTLYNRVTSQGRTIHPPSAKTKYMRFARKRIKDRLNINMFWNGALYRKFSQWEKHWDLVHNPVFIEDFEKQQQLQTEMFAFDDNDPFLSIDTLDYDNNNDNELITSYTNPNYQLGVEDA